MTIDEQLAYLRKGTSEIIPEEALRKKLERLPSGRNRLVVVEGMVDEQLREVLHAGCSGTAHRGSRFSAKARGPSS